MNKVHVKVDNFNSLMALKRDIIEYIIRAEGREGGIDKLKTQLNESFIQKHTNEYFLNKLQNCSDRNFLKGFRLFTESVDNKEMIMRLFLFFKPDSPVRRFINFEQYKDLLSYYGAKLKVTYCYQHKR